MIKYIFKVPLKGLQGFINLFSTSSTDITVMPSYSCISKLIKMVNVTFKTKNKGSI
ncbi:Mobile element protein [Candidatus Enterovibrio altilux]|uniref:Mobile element protein n=1 Tax=Candidatus Enterovibrio altilux TaxID=1927128 RepID=A0A291B6H7_9GAMM|nr:Mobile element protein [Candidatus Enterovibrio luxaltus]